MKILQTSFAKKGFQFKQLWRDEDYAIYQQTLPDDPKFIRYEAIKIKKLEIDSNKGLVKQVAGEYYPSTSDWGIEAFTCFTLELAHLRIEKMKQERLNTKLVRQAA